MLNLLTDVLLWIGSREEDDMIAMLWAQQIMLGEKTFAQVPRLLREKVRELLIDSDVEELTHDD
jgi:hypothetical protein